MRLFPDDLAFADAEDWLLGAARDVTGLSDFGDFDDDDAHEGLRVLLRSYDEDADLSPVGRQMAASAVVSALSTRLASEEGWKQNPEARDVAIKGPVVIVGLPRTGTTALQRMLCAVDSKQGLELWLAQHPQPRPSEAAREQDPAYRRCREALAAQHKAAPELSAIHTMQADAVDECWHLFRQSFASVTFECIARVSGYARWWRDCEMRPAYRRWLQNLQLIGLRDPQKRWVLKDPSHLFAPGALLKTLPDALVVMTHRDPARTIPSVCSLNAAARGMADRAPDDKALGREQLALWERGIRRTLAAREEHPERFLDVHFGELRSDPLGVLRRIEARLGGELTPRDEAALSAWLEAQPRTPHHYEAERFGLTPGAIRERFVDYIETCGVALEG